MAYKLAIIGLGKIAQDQHLPVVAKSEDFELAAVVSPDSPYDSVPCFKNSADLFASGIKLDAVSICTPPGPRFACAREAIDAGMHVLVEKPPHPTMGELDALTRYAAARQRILFTAWHSQYNDAVDEAQRLLAGKTVTKLHVEWKEDVRYWHPGQEWIWEPGGFGVFDTGINAFSIVTKILPEPIFVTSAELVTPRNRFCPIAVRATFKPSWRGNADLSADIDWRQEGEQTWNMDIETADGFDLKLRKGGTELYVNGQLKTAPSEVVLTGEYEEIYAHFAELLASGQSHVDGAPLQLVSDCFMLGRRVDTEDFV